MARQWLILVALVLSLATGVASHAADPLPESCETACGVSSEDYQYCTCPEWTDRRGEESACGNWEIVGGCWYE